MKSTRIQFRIYLYLFFGTILLSNCTTPQRLGYISNPTTNGSDYKYRSNNSAPISDIKVEIGPISSEDNFTALAIVKNNIATLISNNYSYTSIKSKYPNAKVYVDIDLSETKKKTVVLDLLFYYPGSGWWPITPWWGHAKLDTKVHFDIPNKGRASFDFLISENYTIICYPYYRAQKIITEKYQMGWDNLSEQLIDFDFVANWTGSDGVFDVPTDTYSTQNQNRNNSALGNNTKPPVVDKSQKIEAPILTIDQSSIKFKDVDLNNRIDGNEVCSISFDIENEGKGFGLNLSATITESNNVGITTTANYSIGKVEPKSKKSVTIPLSGSLGLKTGVAKIQINFKEQNAFQPDPILIDIPTYEFQKPEIKVVDFSFLTDNGMLKLGYPIQLKAIIQNMGQGDAEAITVDFRCPEQNVFRNTESHFTYGSLKSGESVEVVFEFVANKLYTAPTVPIKIQIGEKYNLYAKNKDVAATIDSQSSGGTISIVSNAVSTPKTITEVSLHSDVDKGIPLGISINKKKYALIIGNEDYSKYQTSLDKEVNVDFAANDARVFAEYCEKTLGYPKENIIVVVDGTRGQMSQELAKLVRLAEVEKGQAELLFYYSGHGLPEEGSNIPYLIPVDVSGTQPAGGIALTYVYDELSKFPTKKTIVILDACFSGGARNKELVAMKGVKVSANVDAVPSNLVVLASSSGNEASAVYREKQHGYFTYFLLKNLQTNKGQGTLETIITEVSQNVAREAARVGKNQTPNVLPGVEIGDGWKDLGW